MGDINEYYFIKQLKCDNKKFVTIIPRLIRDVNTNLHEHNGDLSVVCVTNDDNVYVYHCIDEQHIDVNENSVSEPNKVIKLCQKQVIDIKCGVGFMIALTKCGRVYSWGENYCGQLGHANTKNNLYVRPAVIKSLLENFIVGIECGAYHSLALTRNGEVFEWGWSAMTRENITIATQVIALQFHTIIAIACGALHSLVLTDNGEVFSWGWNASGQLGIGNNSHQCKPIRIDNLNGDKIVKISCGAHHSMLLSENGDIYVFGRNDFGQIGDETTVNKNIPIKLIIDTKFVDIASSGFLNDRISTGLSVDGFCYVWGYCGERVIINANVKMLIITKPSKSQFHNIDEVMRNYSKFKVTYKPHYFMKTYENMTPMERFKETFNKSESKFNDITFKIGDKCIYAQKQYLLSVCQHFDTLFSNEWIESTNSVIEITQYSYSVYYAFLKYFYTNSVDIQSKDLIELYYLSDSYFEENLKQNCVEIMKEVVNVNNVIDFYAFAVNNNYNELENYTFDYMKDRMKDIFKSQSYIQLNDNEILRKLLETYAK